MYEMNTKKKILLIVGCVLLVLLTERLVFSWVTASMDADMGLSRSLPQPPKSEEVETKSGETFQMEVRVDSVDSLSQTVEAREFEN